VVYACDLDEIMVNMGESGDVLKNGKDQADQKRTQIREWQGSG
jgi:hypothetical protein